MKNTTTAIVIVVVLSLVIISGVGNYMLHMRVLDRMTVFDRALKVEREEVIMSTHTTTWISGGEDHAHTTTQNSNESESAWQTRHADEVASWKVIYPPD